MNELTGRVAFVTGASGLVALPAIALATSTIRCGAGVIEPVSIHPGQIAMFASALQEMSGGCFILGLGAGSDAFFHLAGLAAPAPVPRTRNAILVIRALPLCLPPRHVLRVRDQIAVGAAARRSVEDLDIVASLWTAVDDDREVARGLLARQIARYAGSLSMEALAAYGFDPDVFARTQRILDSEGEAAATASVCPHMLDLGIAGSAADVITGAAELLAMTESCSVEAALARAYAPPAGSDVLVCRLPA